MCFASYLILNRKKTHIFIADLSYNLLQLAFCIELLLTIMCVSKKIIIFLRAHLIFLVVYRVAKRYIIIYDIMHLSKRFFFAK